MCAGWHVQVRRHDWDVMWKESAAIASSFFFCRCLRVRSVIFNLLPPSSATFPHFCAVHVDLSPSSRSVFITLSQHALIANALPLSRALRSNVLIFPDQNDSHLTCVDPQSIYLGAFVTSEKVSLFRVRWKVGKFIGWWTLFVIHGSGKRSLSPGGWRSLGWKTFVSYWFYLIQKKENLIYV